MIKEIIETAPLIALGIAGGLGGLSLSQAALGAIIVQASVNGVFWIAGPCLMAMPLRLQLVSGKVREKDNQKSH